MQSDALVEWTFTELPASVSAEEPFSVQLTARIADGWHVYSISQPPGGPMATSISMPPGQAFRLAGPIAGPKPESVWDETFEMDTEYYAGAATFMIPLQVDANDASGSKDLVVEISFQGCSESTCRPPAKVRVSAPVKVSKPI